MDDIEFRREESHSGSVNREDKEDPRETDGEERSKIGIRRGEEAVEFDVRTPLAFLESLESPKAGGSIVFLGYPATTRPADCQRRADRASRLAHSRLTQLSER